MSSPAFSKMSELFPLYAYAEQLFRNPKIAVNRYLENYGIPGDVARIKRLIALTVSQNPSLHPRDILRSKKSWYSHKDKAYRIAFWCIKYTFVRRVREKKNETIR